MGRIDLDFDAPRGLVFADDDGRLGVVTTMMDRKGNITQDPAEACSIVVFMGLDCPEGSWLSVAVEPRLSNREALPAGSA